MNGINFSDKGQGDVSLVFLHYWGGSTRTWRRVTHELSDTFRTIAIDHRGWGESHAPDDGHTIGQLADDALEVIEKLHLARYVLVGHSMGGKVAQLIASRQPKGLEALVLVAPSPPSPTLLPDEQRNGMLGAYASRESIEWLLDNVLTGSALSEEDREQVIEDSMRGAPQAIAAWPNVMMREDISADVAHIDVPTHVIAGAKDQVDRVDTLQKELLPRIAGASLEVLNGVGHLSPLEAPLSIASAIRRFTRTVKPQTAA